MERALTHEGKGREQELLRQQDILARFGELAIRSDDLGEILHEACVLVGEALGTDLAKVMELQEDGITSARQDRRRLEARRRRTNARGSPQGIV